MQMHDLLMDLAVRYGFQVLGAIVILAAGFIAGRWIGKLTDAQLQRQAMEPPMRKLIVQVVRIVVLLLAVIVALDKFGFQIAPLVAGIGVAGLGVGIAMQGVLSNLVAGLTIIFTKPFRVGEHIAVAGVSGEVVAVELSSTTLTHPDRSRIIIPNRKIVGEILHNYGVTRQLNVAVAVPHLADASLLLGAAREVVSANPRVLKDPTPVIGVAQVSDAGVKLAIQPWVRAQDMGAVEAELYEAIVQDFRARGIREMPLKHDVRLVNGAAVAASGR